MYLYIYKGSGEGDNEELWMRKEAGLRCEYSNAIIL